ncbi:MULTISPECIES: Hsp20 family protein [Sneathiella]|jgi:molecular chaperone IbpA|uniref:Hsp20 family protein n=1 Tax=Sneathiella TaxID=510690 RepID=UPI00146C5BFD|nr:Hsp20 family protein [Sneathiella aquimaris]
MRHFDFTPLMRSTIGYDRIGQLFEGLEQASTADKFPPYNIVKKDPDHYRITMAVAGFSEDEIEITATQNSLKITGKSVVEEEDGVEYLHKGIAGRAFTQTFELADTVKVAGASMNNGLLHIELHREIPEALKPRSIKIEKQKMLEGKKAA